MWGQRRTGPDLMIINVLLVLEIRPRLQKRSEVMKVFRKPKGEKLVYKMGNNLLALTVKLRKPSRNYPQTWKQCYIKNLSTKFPTEEHEN